MKKNRQLSLLSFILLIGTIVFAIIEIPQFKPDEELTGNNAWGAMAQGFIKVGIFIGISYSLITLALIWFSKRFRTIIYILNTILVLTASWFLFLYIVEC